VTVKCDPYRFWIRLSGREREEGGDGRGAAVVMLRHRVGGGRIRGIGLPRAAIVTQRLAGLDVQGQETVLVFFSMKHETVLAFSSCLKCSLSIGSCHLPSMLPPLHSSR
jgi:hypothetical protein